MKFKPTNNRLLVKPDTVKEETASGILLPDSSKKEKPSSGEIIIGNATFKKGERILFSRYGFDEVVLDDETYYLVGKDNVLGTF